VYLVVSVAAQVPVERHVAALSVNSKQSVVVAADQRVPQLGVQPLVRVARSQPRDHVTGSKANVAVCN